MKSAFSKNSILALAVAAALGLSGCGSSDSNDLPDPVPPTPTTPPTPDPVVPPETDTAPVLAFVVSGSVIDSSTELLVSDVTLTFRENGELATNLVDTDGNAFSTIESADGTFTFTAAEGATLGNVQITAQLDGYVDEVKLVDLSVVESDTTVILSVVSQEAPGVAVVTETRTVADATVEDEVVVEANSENSESTAEVAVPAGTQLQDADGNPVSGTQVFIEVTVVDTEQDTAAEEETASAAEVVPPGLNDENAEDVQIPVGVTNVEMVDDQGNEIESFSQPISITINLPDNGEIAEGDVYALSSYDEDTGVWTNEDSDATIGAQDATTGLFPASFEIDHLTFFAITRTEPRCSDGVIINTLGDSVPANGLLVTMQSTDMGELFGITQDGATTLLTGAQANAVNVSQTATASVRVFDFSGNTWFQSAGEVSVCGTFDVQLTAPVTYTSEDFSVSATCNNDNTVSAAVPRAAVRYAQAGNAAQNATNSGDGVYNLADLVQGATYTVTVDPRISDENGDVAPQTTTITADGTAESIDFSVACAGGTGAG